MADKKTVIANLSGFFSAGGDAQGSHVGNRLLKMIGEAKRVLAPPFPRQIQVETTNICNHGCSFCAYPLMHRPRRHMDKDLFRRLVKEAYECGAREIGLFAGAEPLTCKRLDEYAAYCRDIGYEYMYISTNGAIGGPETFRRLLDAGLHSIKFSVNGGDREVYRRVHGSDDFDKVIANIRYVADYRKNVPQKVYLGVSFVGMPDTNHSFEDLKNLLTGIVDEIIYYEASNQSGQMPHLPDPPYRDCHLPFNKAHISREGFLKACCNDYENLLAVEDLNSMSMMEAWHSPRFQALRQRHLDDELTGTVCANCIRRCTTPPAPLNEKLVQHTIFWSKKPEPADGT